MSIRVDTTSLIPGAFVVGHRGLGVLGSQVPSGGQHGAGYLYNDLSLPVDANKEVRGLILTPPAAGTFFAFEDSSFTFTDAPFGTYSFTYRLFEDGVDKGAATSTISVGDTTVVGTSSWTEAGDTMSAGGAVSGVPVSGAAAWTEDADAVLASGTVAANAAGTVAIVETDDALAATGSVAVVPSGVTAWTEQNDSVAMTGETDVVFVNAPAGSGYTPKRTENTTRPAAIQRNYR